MATERQMVPDTQGRNPLGYESVGKLLLAFSVPSVISMLVNSVYNIVDAGHIHHDRFRRLRLRLH